jgi:hypothetical protein
MRSPAWVTTKFRFDAPSKVSEESTSALKLILPRKAGEFHVVPSWKLENVSLKITSPVDAEVADSRARAAKAHA